MANIQYIGARYVPKFFDNPDDHSNDWKAGIAYEPLTVVTYQDDSYTSKKPVPGNIGNPADNSDYWVKTMNFSGAIEGLQEEISDIKNGQINDDVLELDKLTPETINKLVDNSKIIFMPVGDTGGNCTVIITKPLNKVVMLDTGYTDVYTDIKRLLAANGVTHVDYFLLSHPHRDHFGNLPSLISDHFIDMNTVVYIPIQAAGASSWNTLLAEVIADLGSIPYQNYSSDEKLEVDKFTFEFFNCDAEDYAYYESEGVTDANVYCVCTYVNCNEFSLLMTGDCTAQGLSYNAGKFRKVDILQIPHHGYRSGQADLYLYLATDPAYGVVFMPKSYYDSVDDYLRSSTRLQYFTSLGHPFYMMGMGPVYAGVSENDFTLISSAKNIPANAVETVPLYVDTSYTGDSDGYGSRPFKTLSQALSFAASIKNANQVTINIVGDYNQPTEEIVIRNMPCILDIKGEDAVTKKVILKSASIQNSFVILEQIHFTDVSTDPTIAIGLHSYVKVQNCVIDGDKTGASSVPNGVHVQASGGSWVEITDTEISNARACILLREGGNANIYTMSGTGNEHLIGGANGGVVIGGAITAAYSGTMLVSTLSGRKAVMAAQFDKTGFNTTGPYCIYTGVSDGTTTVTDTLNLRNMIQNYESIIRIMSPTGAIYQINRKGGASWSTPELVQTATDSSVDTDFAVSMSGNNLSVTYKKYVKVIVF